MKTKSKLAISALILMSLNQIAYAQSEGSHGGVQECSEYHDMMVQLNTALSALPEADVLKISPKIDRAQIERQVTNLKVTPSAEPLDRTIKSNPDEDTSIIDIKKYQDMLSVVNKYRLDTHELLVLGNVERDGEYRVSDQLFQALFLAKLIPEFKNSEYYVNPNGKILVIEGATVATIFEENTQRKIQVTYSDGVFRAYLRTPVYSKRLATVKEADLNNKHRQVFGRITTAMSFFTYILLGAPIVADIVAAPFEAIFSKEIKSRKVIKAVKHNRDSAVKTPLFEYLFENFGLSLHDPMGDPYTISVDHAE